MYNLGTGVLELKVYDQAVGFEIIVPSCGNDQSKIYNLLEEATNLKNEWLYYLDVADDLIVHSIVYADKEILKPYLKEKPQAILW